MTPIVPLDQKLDPRSTALLIVDVQNDFCADPRRTSGPTLGQVISGPLSTLLDAARSADATRVFIRAIYDERYVSGPFAEKLAELGILGRTCQEGTPGAEFWPPFLPQPGEITVDKHRYSAFRETGLAQTLRDRGIRTVVVAGVTTGTCVESTARDAFFEDFYVVIASDATAEPDPARQEDRLRMLGRMFATVLPASGIAAVWTAVTAR